MHTNNSYLLVLHWAMDAPGGQQTTVTQMIACPDGWHVVKELACLPLDFLHPAVVKAQQLPRCAGRIEVISLLNGKSVAEVFINKTSVNLLLKGTLKTDLHMPGSTLNEQQAIIQWLPIAVFKDMREGLRSTAEYVNLIGEAGRKIRNDANFLFRQSYMLTTIGTDFSQPSVEAGKLKFRQFQRDEHALSAASALQQLLAIPSACFDHDSAIVGDERFYYQAACILNHMRPEHILAQTLLVKAPAAVWDKDNHTQTGRMLVFDKELQNAFVNLGFTQADIAMYGDKCVVQLDAWDPSSGILVPLPRKLGHQLNTLHDGTTVEPAGKFIVQQRFAYVEHQQPGANPATREIEQEMTEERLIPALFKLMLDPPSAYDRELSKRNGRFVEKASMLDASGLPLIVVGREDAFGERLPTGVYIGFHQSIMDHPELKALHIDQLGLCSDRGWLRQGPMQIAQMATYEGGTLSPTTVYVKFSTTLLMQHMKSLLEECPERMKVAPQHMLPAAPYYLAKEWTVLNPASGTCERFVYLSPALNAPSAIASLVAAEQDYYQPQAPMGIQLTQCRVIEGSKMMPLLVQSPAPLQFNYTGCPQHMPDDFLSCYKSFEQTRANAPPDQRRSRNIRDADPTGRRKKGK